MFEILENEMNEFMKDLQQLINRHNIDADHNVSDFILAEYIGKCLNAYQVAIKRHDSYNKSYNKKYFTISKGWKQPREIILQETLSGPAWYFVPHPNDHPAQNAFAGFMNDIIFWEVDNSAESTR